MDIGQKPSAYTSGQILQYLEHVRFQNIPSKDDIEKGRFPCSIDNLRFIVRLNRLTFPFENTAMHYSPTHTMHSTAEGAFDWMIATKRGYGSHCCGLGVLLLEVLRGLGYRAYASLGQWNMAALRDSEEVEAGFIPAPRAHMFLLVQTSDSTDSYVVDAGEGEVIGGSASPEEFRITLDDNNSEIPLKWAMEMRCGLYMPEWRILFKFGSEPATASEIESMNNLLTQRKESKTFWNDVFCVAYFLVDQEAASGDESKKLASLSEGEMFKLVLTGGKVTKRMGDTTEAILEVHSEVERIVVLREYFSIIIDEEDIMHIEGRAPQLPFTNSDNDNSSSFQH